ncbi:MAG: GNAT family N-acetyltransferase [Ruminococcaceae bacterium]|nr:GNAT family N-acetyltransferase [Oscillospiraceae bacterium]
MCLIRNATLTDLDAVVSIYDAIHYREEAGLSTTGWVRSVYPTRSTAKAAIEAGDLFVMEENGQVIAAARINQIQGAEYARANWSQDVASCKVMVLHTLVVSPDMAGTGCGTCFVRFYEEYAARRGCPFLRMDTNERNMAARALYRNLGYREVGIVPCIFNGIDGVRLVCLEKIL